SPLPSNGMLPDCPAPSCVLRQMAANSNALKPFAVLSEMKVAASVVESETTFHAVRPRSGKGTPPVVVSVRASAETASGKIDPAAPPDPPPPAPPPPPPAAPPPAPAADPPAPPSCVPAAPPGPAPPAVDPAAPPACPPAPADDPAAPAAPPPTPAAPPA